MTIALRALSAAMALAAGLSVATAAADDAVDPVDRERIEPILTDYCIGCHAGEKGKGGVALDRFASDADRRADRELWWRVLKNVRAGVMPPFGEPRPTGEEQRQLVAWIKREVLGADPENPDPGRVTLRRLNRVEYRNTIRDLMGVDYRTDEEFPADDTGYGFDTIGEVLTVSPLLLEKHLHAAETIVDRAVPTRPRVVRETRIAGEKFTEADGQRTGERLSFYQPASVAATAAVERPGDYRIIVELEVDGEFDFDPGRCRVTFSLDGREVLRQEFAWQNHKRFEFEVPVNWLPGDHGLSLSLEPLVPEEQKRQPLDLRLTSVRVQGPLDPAQWVATKNYDRFFTLPEPPTEARERRDYARDTLRRFVLRAFRRPAEPALIERLVELADGVSSRPGRTFEEGIAQAMAAVLASPRFLFRMESLRALGGASEPGRFPLLDDYALASRLSYFLWSSMPDDELLRLAELGVVRERLGPQVRRMLEDERSEAFVSHFLGQWLQVRDVETVSLNARAILRRDNLRRRDDPLDGELRRSLRRESELVFGHVVRGDRNVLELLDADYTFVNERLARHYGLPEVEGRRLRRVALPPDSPLGGILTQGSTLLVTSNPTRTSPVKRGLFLLENILGTPAPPPPADVPELEDAARDFQGREPTMRELLEAHRQKPLCAACHARMDPLGLALENFNALGMWRDSDGGQPIDAAGQLLTGERFRDIGELKRVLTGPRRQDFYRCLTEKLLTYALGRGLDAADVATVDAIVERLEREQGRFSALLLGVVESAAFQRRRP